MAQHVAFKRNMRGRGSAPSFIFVVLLVIVSPASAFSAIRGRLNSPRSSSRASSFSALRVVNAPHPLDPFFDDASATDLLLRNEPLPDSLSFEADVPPTPFAGQLCRQISKHK